MIKIGMRLIRNMRKVGKAARRERYANDPEYRALEKQRRREFAQDNPGVSGEAAVVYAGVSEAEEGRRSGRRIAVGSWEGWKGSRSETGFMGFVGLGNCQNARRIWSSTPQIADWRRNYTDDADFGDFCLPSVFVRRAGFGSCLKQDLQDFRDF